MAEFRRNTRNIGSYIIGNTLGEGAFGKVKIGTHIHTGEKVAIKILDKEKMKEDPDDIVRVQSEIAILKKMRHKNIIQLYEIMESSRNIYLIMEYCEEKELFDYITTRKRLTESEALKFFQEIIDTLDYLHCQNIVHRDLKPENLLLDYKLSIKLSDFGLSRTYTNDKLLSTPCGTPSYAPPEMLNGEDYHGLLSDIWSAGVVLYAMLAGYLPFDESNEEINCQKIIKGEFTIPDWVSDSCADMLKCVLVTDPFWRYDLDQIKNHPWFNSSAPSLRPGIIIGYHIIPIDDYILEQVESFGYNKLKTKENILNNRFCVMTAIYYLILRKFIKEGRTSISDLESQEYLRYIQDENNIIEIIPEENSRNLEDISQDDEQNHENEDNVYVNSNMESINPSKAVSVSIKNNENNEDDSLRKQSHRYSTNTNGNQKISVDSNEDKVINLYTERQQSLNKTDNNNLSFKNFDSVFPRKEQRSVTISQQENFANRFANRKSLFFHEDLGKFFDASRVRRMSALSGLKSTLIDSMPRVSLVLNKFRRNTSRNENLKLDDDKIQAFLKLNNRHQSNSPIDELPNITEFQSSNKLTINFNTNPNQSNEKIKNFNSSSCDNSMSSESDLDKSVETVHSKRRSIINYDISPDKFSNYKKSPVKLNSNKMDRKQPKSEYKKINSSEQSNKNCCSLINSRLNNIQFRSRSKFFLKTKSKDKYNIEKLRPKMVFKKEKNLKLQNSEYLKTKMIKKVTNVSLNKNYIKPVVEPESSLQKEREIFYRSKKFIKDSRIFKNETSIEKSRSKTPNRNLSYSSYQAKKSTKDRIEEMPWNLMKKIIEVESFPTDINTNQFDSIKGIVERYEKFKKKHWKFNKPKVQEKNFRVSWRNGSKNLYGNEITIQDIQSSPNEKTDKANERDSKVEFLNKIQPKETTSHRTKKFVTFEENSGKKVFSKYSSAVKYTNYITVSNKKYSNNELQSKTKGNQTTPFNNNLKSKEANLNSSNKIKEINFNNKKYYETYSKKNHTEGNGVNISSFYNTVKTKPNKINPVSNRVFTTVDKNLNYLKLTSGPIDIDSIHICDDANKLVEKIIEILNTKKIIFVQTNPYKFKCTKIGVSFEIQLYKLDEDEDYFTFKYRMFQGGSVNFRKLCQSITTEIC